MKVAIAGYGLEGESSYRYYKSLDHDVTILDEQTTLQRPLPSGATIQLGSRAFDGINEFDLVIRTAGLSPDRLADAKKIWSSTNEFFSRCPAPIVGVTGTKGKSTTSTMIASMLRESGHNVHLLGNIGTTPLDALSDISDGDIVVFELSSFQLWDAEFSPHIAVILPVGSDHLDAHDTQARYVAAKSNIAYHQSKTDFVIYAQDNEASSEIAYRSPGKAIAYNSAASRGSVTARDGYLYEGDNQICPTNAIQLPGHHNVQNSCAAATAALLAGASYKGIEKGLRSLKQLPHRMQYVATIDGVDYYDDNYSSSLVSALAAARTFERPTVLIVGGRDRGIERSAVLTQIAAEPTLKHVICIGEVRHSLDGDFRRLGLQKSTVVDGADMSVIVSVARERASPGDVVIMSPGFASFDMFENFTRRGEQYVSAVTELM